MPQKGHTNNPNGRPRGSSNKVTTDMRRWLQMVIDNNRSKFEKDLSSVEPVQRLLVLEKLMQYCVPKLQSLDTQTQLRLEYQELERLLQNAPDDAVRQISERVAALGKLSSDTKSQ